jgi:hypothetical protein
MSEDKNTMAARELYWQNKLAAIAPRATSLVVVDAVHTVGGGVRYMLVGVNLDGVYTAAQLRAIADTLDGFA